jgi:hypothetical protein
MDPETQTLAAQLAATAVRNTASSIADKITAAKARRRNEETIAELEEIIYSLIDDKSELLRISQAFEAELVTQRLLTQLLESASQGRGQSPSAARAMVDQLQPLLSVETVKIMQIIGFNFRKAIGEPLTELLRLLIMSKSQQDPELSMAVQRAYLEVAQDPEAYARLATMVPLQPLRAAPNPAGPAADS